MPLSPGTKLGQYEVVESIGAGGMGEVYRARDTKLGRDVAIKVLPEEFARDKERLGRFEREARLLAQVNHSNIATLHGLEEHDGQKFIVMELVEGETLTERISKGPIPIDEAIPLFIQIAEGLEAAHEKGIIHRDLKPANRFPTDWVGDTIVLVALNPSTSEDVELLTLDAPDAIRPIANRPFNESAADLSPDGRRAAYRSGKTGISEVYVQSLERIADTAEYQISVNGGGLPVWSADGNELFFVGTEGGQRMMVVSILQTSPFQASAPKVLFRNDGSFQWGAALGIREFDVTPDGQRFLMLQRDAPATTTEVHIVLNWLQELERLVPTDQ